MRMRSEVTGLSRWPWVIGGTAVLVIGGVVLYSQAMPTNPPAPPPAPAPASSVTPAPQASAAASGAGDDDPGVAPTGCLGGLDRNAAMVLTAQKQAPHTTYGAVEVAAAFHRWLWQYPDPGVDDITAVSTNVISTDASPAWKDIASEYAAAGNDPTHGVVSAGTPFHISTTNGLWAVGADSSADQVKVNLAAGYVVDGALSPTKVAGIALVMKWSNGAWHVFSGNLIDQALLAQGGIRYTGGC